MNRIRNIFRLVFFLVAVLLLVDINRKTNDNAQSIVEFKFKMLQKIQVDSLDAQQKVNLLVDETTKFVDTSSRVRDGLHYLTLLFVLLVVVELTFLGMIKRNVRKEVN